MYGAAIYILPVLYVCVCICYCIAMWTRKMEMHLKLHLRRCISNLFLFPLALLHANFMQKYVKFSILNDVVAAVLYSYSLLHWQKNVYALKISKLFYFLQWCLRICFNDS